MINNFPKLWSALSAAISPRRAADKISEVVFLQMVMLRELISSKLPEGHEEPAKYDRERRPSVRQHGDTLLNSFITTPLSERTEVSGSIVEHMSEIGLIHKTYSSGPVGILEWLIEGTDSHPISAREGENLLFFWELKNKWIAPTSVEHPGAKAMGDFVQDAIDEGYADRSVTYDNAMQWIAFNELWESPILHG